MAPDDASTPQGAIPLTAIDVVSPGDIYLEPAVLSFTLSLPIRPVEQSPVAAPRR